jgi:hypothetical protein
MADGLLSNVLGAIDRKKQEVKAGLGLLANNPQEWAAQATARYFPTKEEERQFRMVKKMGGDITQTPYYQKIFDLSQFQSSLKPLSKTQFQVANEVAQKNATEMLGLPPNNTAMDRAKALGFVEEGYTGTNRDIVAFDPSKAGASGSGSREGKLGTWLTNDPRVASSFADWSARGQGGDVVYPLMIRGKNPKEFSSYKEIQDLVDANTQFRRPPYRMMQDTIDYETAKKAIGDYGALRNTITDAIDVPITQYVVPDASRLRSRFAAFDPARVNESDLLAAGIPIGLLGSTQVELPKKQEKKPKK